METVVYRDEAAVLGAIRDFTPHDDNIAPYITFIKQMGKPIADWTWDERYLRYKGKIYVPGDEELRHAMLHVFHDTRMAGHIGTHLKEVLLAWHGQVSGRLCHRM